MVHILYEGKNRFMLHEDFANEIMALVFSYIIPHRYRWLVYINPNYFGLSSVAFFVLSDFDTQCRGSQLECYATSGPQVLSNFFFDNINPYLHIVVRIV